MDKKLKELAKKANAAQKDFITADALYDDAERIQVAASEAVDTAYGIANKANKKANKAAAAYGIAAYHAGEIK